MIRVAINGFGRIGRGFLRAVIEKGKKGETGEMEIMAINDLASAENLAYLLKYDTVYGRAKFSVAAAPNALVVNGKNISIVAEKEPAKLPWKDMQIDIVIESTGLFT